MPDVPAGAAFVEQFASALADAGMPRMPARVLARLIADDEGASTAAREGVAAVGPDSPAGRRMADTAAFFEFLEEEMAGLLDRWRARRQG